MDTSQLQPPSEVTKGKATFKQTHNETPMNDNSVNMESSDSFYKPKPVEVKKKKLKKPKTQADIMQEQMENKFMKNEEIKEICIKNNLTRMEVYDIRSQFTSMCMISEGYVAGDTQNEETTNTEKGGNKFKEPQKEGIPLGFFIKNCSFLAGTLPHISKRLIAAKGKNSYQSIFN